MNRFGQHASEPVWRTRAKLIAHPVPAYVAGWLFDSGSLTRRVKLACGGQFRVEVIFQGWGRPMLNEAVRLGMDESRRALIREVYLYCDASPWVYARTIIPPTTLSGRQRHLAHLGNRPLGEMLFADPAMWRDEVEIACIRPAYRLFNIATAALGEAPTEIWGRRSVFYTGKKPLLVNEIFLPPLLELPPDPAG
ncbi:MAG: chorismate lyase [Proteobacteria bacterium]|jgi:chorismate lyase|nr:chorismate lyase [Pseudomonadota bacterium]